MENEAYHFIKKFARLRKDNEAFNTGKLMQFTPRAIPMFIFRYTATECFMVIVNRMKGGVKYHAYEERLDGFTKGKDHVIRI